MKETVQFSDGSVDWICTYSYDENDRCILKQTDNGNAWQTDLVNTYDDRGNLIGVFLWDGGQTDGYLLSHECHTYDEQDRLISSHCDFDEICWRDTTYQYDRQGRKTLVESRDYEADRPGCEKRAVTYIYDGADRLIREETTCVLYSGESVEPGAAQEKTVIRITEYTYDEEDRLVKERFDDGVTDPVYKLYFYDQDGMLSRTEEGEYVTRFIYDGDGVLLEEWSYDNCGENEMYHVVYKYTSKQGGPTINE